jgi:hypothetical protein
VVPLNDQGNAHFRGLPDIFPLDRGIVPQIKLVHNVPARSCDRREQPRRPVVVSPSTQARIQATSASDRLLLNRKLALPLQAYEPVLSFANC